MSSTVPEVPSLSNSVQCTRNVGADPYYLVPVYPPISISSPGCVLDMPMRHPQGPRCWETEDRVAHPHRRSGNKQVIIPLLKVLNTSSKRCQGTNQLFLQDLIRQQSEHDMVCQGHRMDLVQESHSIDPVQKYYH